MRSFVSKASRIFTVLLVVLLMSSVFLININADSVQAANEALLQEKFDALGQKQTQNIVSDEGKKVNNIINTYYIKLNSIESSELELEATADVINLYYEQGMAANDVAWIYYSHVDSFDQQGEDAVTDTHNELQAEIAIKTDADILKALNGASYKDGGLCARMYYAIYSEKLDDLLVEGDSTAVKGKIAAAKLALQECDDFSLGSTQFEEILDNTAVSVDVQRNQDKALAELDAVFAILCPDADLSENEAYLSARELIDDNATTTVQQMNSYLETAVMSQLTGMQTGTYVSAYVAELKTALGAEFDAAGTTRIADVAVLLADHDDELLRAQAKDTIKDHIAYNNVDTHAKMISLEADYNAASGIIDNCQNAEEVQFQVEKAKMRVNIYIKYLEAIDAIIAAGGSTNAADTAYGEQDDLLVQATEDNLDERYHTAIGVLEVITYETKHKAILDKQAKDIELSDKNAILAAINDAKALSMGARNTLKDKLNALATKYTKITQQEISKVLSGNDLHHTYVNELQLMAGDLALSGDVSRLAEDFDALISEADALVAKATAIDTVLDRYYGIVTDVKNDGFSTAAGNELMSIAKTAADKIAADPVANASATSANAVVALNRAEAKAQIDVKLAQRNDLTADTRQMVQAIIDTAIAEIDGATDALAISNIAKSAIFAIDKEFDVQDMTSAAEELKSDVNADINLTDKQKKSLTDRIDGALADASDRVRDSVDELEKNTARQSFNGALDVLDNEAQLKSAKMAEVAGVLAAEKQTAEGFSYLTEEQRGAVKDALDAVYAKLAEDFVPSLSDAQINELAADARASITTAVSEGQAQNESAKSEQIAAARTAIESAETQASDAIDALTFLDDTAKAELKAKLAAAADKAETGLAEVGSTADINAVQAAALGSFESVMSEGRNKDNAARAVRQNSSKGDIDTKKAQVNDAIEEMTYLSDGEKAALKAKADDTVDAAFAAIASGESAEVVEKVRTDALSALEAILADAEKQDLDNAKAAAIEELTAQKNKISSEIDGFKYLNEEERSAIKDELASMLAYAEAQIEVADSVEAVERLRNNAADALDDKEQQARSSEDAACVDKLTPVVIALGAVGVVEAVAIAVLLSRRKKMGLAAFVPFASMMKGSLKLQPTDMWTLTGVLVFADVVMGIIILYLVLQLLKHKNADTGDDEEETLEQVVQEVMEQIPEEPEPVQEEIEQEEPVEVTDMELVNACEADTVEPYSGMRRAEINIDTISMHFADGETVTLNSLKAKKLISRQAGYVKVLARGDLDKKITVVAQSFSAAAIKAIVIKNGGMAIVDKPAPERRH